MVWIHLLCHGFPVLPEAEQLSCQSVGPGPQASHSTATCFCEDLINTPRRLSDLTLIKMHHQFVLVVDAESSHTP